MDRDRKLSAACIARSVLAAFGILLLFLPMQQSDYYSANAVELLLFKGQDVWLTSGYTISGNSGMMLLKSIAGFLTVASMIGLAVTAVTGFLRKRFARIIGIISFICYLLVTLFWVISVIKGRDGWITVQHMNYALPFIMLAVSFAGTVLSFLIGNDSFGHSRFSFDDLSTAQKRAVIIAAVVLFAPLLLSLPAVIWRGNDVLSAVAWVPMLLEWLLYYVTVAATAVLSLVLLLNIFVGGYTKRGWLVLLAGVFVVGILNSVYGFILHQAGFVPPFSDKPFVPFFF